jgi:hypothetical protein
MLVTAALCITASLNEISRRTSLCILPCVNVNIWIEIIGARYGDALFLLQFAVYQPLINGTGMGKIYTTGGEIQFELNDIAYKGESHICV